MPGYLHTAGLAVVFSHKQLVLKITPVSTGVFYIFDCPIDCLTRHKLYDMSMTVRAKFHCNSIESYIHGTRAKLTAVYGKEGENHDFAKATPSGIVEISIDEDVPASTFFKPGEEYYLDFTNVKAVKEA